MAESKFTPATRGALLERIAAGASLADACRSIGLREATVKGWLTRGRSEATGDYAEFAVAVDEARREALERPAPMTREEFGRYLDRAVRSGSVAAMKLWDERDRRADPPPVEPEQPSSKIADLAARRRRRDAS